MSDLSLSTVRQCVLLCGALEINNLTCARERAHLPRGIYDDTVQLREDHMIYFICGGAMASGYIPLTSGDRISATWEFLLRRRERSNAAVKENLLFEA